jgi:hypothetical protein
MIAAVGCLAIRGYHGRNDQESSFAGVVAKVIASKERKA